MKILVTGGAGFIGSHLVDQLVKQGHQVTVYDYLEPQVHQGKPPDYLNPKAYFVQGDVSDKPKLLEALRDQEIVFHQAAAVGVGQSMYQIQHYVEKNTMATAKLLDLLANTEHCVKKLIVASSMSIYGEGAYLCDDCGQIYPKIRTKEQLEKNEWELKCPTCGKTAKPVPTPETKPLESTSVYAITKKDQEQLCLCVGKAYGIPTVALRYFNVYGPRQSLSNPYTGVCAIFSSRIKNQNPPIVYEDGLQSRDFVSVHDIVEANILAMQKNAANYQAYNVGTGQATTILQVAKTLAKLYDSKLEPRVENKFRQGDIRHCYPDVSKIKKLGYAPKTGFEEGMRELVEWGEKQEAVDKFDQAAKELEQKGLV